MKILVGHASSYQDLPVTAEYHFILYMNTATYDRTSRLSFSVRWDILYPEKTLRLLHTKSDTKKRPFVALRKNHQPSTNAYWFIEHLSFLE